MSKLNVYSLFDNKSLSFEGLYLFPNDETAVRGFRHSISQIPFPEDKDIVYIGAFDSFSGLVVSSADVILTVDSLVPEVIDDK